MARIRAGAVIGGLAAIALVAAGCGGDDNGGGGGGGGASSKPKTQKQASTGGGTAAGLSEDMTDFKFSQPAPKVKAKGGTVTISLKNSGGSTHAMEIEGKGEEVKSKQIDPGQTTTLKAKLAPGTYEFYCPVDGHKKLGMKGKITVQ
jgi:uncharacterized cupredoxin-like copper-binding protein